MALRYKLRMFGVPIEEVAQVFCDNEAVVNGETIPGSTLKKKHVSTSYHRIRESSAVGIILVFKENSESNFEVYLWMSNSIRFRE